MSTGPGAAWKYAITGSLGAMSNGGPPGASCRPAGTRAALLGALLGALVAPCEIRATSVISTSFYSAVVPKALRMTPVLRSQIQVLRGCMVPVAAATSSVSSESRSISERRRTLNAAIVRAASYLER